MRRDLAWAALWLVFTAVLTQFLAAPERGLHRDDIAIVRHMTDLATGEHRIFGGWPRYWGSWRPVGIPLISMENMLMVDHERAVRLGQALIFALSATLMVAAARRISGSRYLATIVALLVAAPHACHEALLWQSAGGILVPGWLMMLAAIHLTWSAPSISPLAARVGVTGLAALLGAAAAMSYDQTVMLLVLLPLPLLTGHGVSADRRAPHGILLAASAVLVLGVLAGLLGSLAGAAGVIDTRGGLVLDHRILTERLPTHLVRIRWLLTSAGQTSEHAQLLADGWASMGRSPLLLSGFVVCSLGAFGLARRAMATGARGSAGRDAVTAGAGLALFFATLVPLSIPAGQIVESRSLLMPWTGLALCAAGLAALATRLPGLAGRLTAGAGLAVALGVGLTSVLVIMGAADMYRLRSEHDQRMLASLVALVGDPPSGTVFVSVDVDAEQDAASGNRWKPSVYSAFEVPYVDGFAIQLAFARADVSAVTASPWRRPAAIVWDPGQPDRLTIGEHEIHWESALFFTPHPDGVTLRYPLRVRVSEGPPVELQPTLGRVLLERGVPADPLGVDLAAG